MSFLKVNQTTRVKELNYEEDSILQIIVPANNCHVNFNLEISRTFY